MDFSPAPPKVLPQLDSVEDLYFTEAIAEFSEVLLGYAMHSKMLRKVRGMK